MKKILTVLALLAMPFLGYIDAAQATTPIMNFQAHPLFHVRKNIHPAIAGLSPTAIKTVYSLPATGGAGTIAIIDAYASRTIASDFNAFNKTFNLPTCTTTNGCFMIHPMTARTLYDSGWGLEESLDVEWAHAIAPTAKILLVEARSSSGNDLLNAVDYARSQKGVVAVSMSWGGGEFNGESVYDSHFVSANGSPISFFASAGDSGAGVEWPSVSANVTGVGGTTLSFTGGVLSSETAWNGSGGGLSQYENEPAYQTTYSVPGANGRRAVPDVSYDADPASGVSVYDTFGYTGWLTVGGTSVGAPQWAAIHALGGNTQNANLYQQPTIFRDIVSGTNGTCGFYCSTAFGYDYITGLGSPTTATF